MILVGPDPCELWSDNDLELSIEQVGALHVFTVLLERAQLDVRGHRENV